MVSFILGALYSVAAGALWAFSRRRATALLALLGILSTIAAIVVMLAFETSPYTGEAHGVGFIMIALGIAGVALVSYLQYILVGVPFLRGLVTVSAMPIFAIGIIVFREIPLPTDSVTMVGTSLAGTAIFGTAIYKYLTLATLKQKQSQ